MAYTSTNIRHFSETLLLLMPCKRKLQGWSATTQIIKTKINAINNTLIKINLNPADFQFWQHILPAFVGTQSLTKMLSLLLKLLLLEASL